MAKKSRARPFEELYQRLEQVVTQLESGDLPLEKSLELFEEGMRLSEQCREALKSAEKRLKVLVKDESGSFTLEEMQGNQTTEGTE
jgi:exodeoxyribonuclease VII small subunit